MQKSLEEKSVGVYDGVILAKDLATNMAFGSLMNNEYIKEDNLYFVSTNS